eukprot:TRINITY_DN7411_c0_g1_i1.p2 TRINITY_DN7411_c0_g1~~TRINITY_DN7411_c0_g1_i1.p2  ORF type:complete len:111 (-),score=22.42 TRINITY_DN7411_c0_g1_i1:109-420(-)
MNSSVFGVRPERVLNLHSFQILDGQTRMKDQCWQKCVNQDHDTPITDADDQCIDRCTRKHQQAMGVAERVLGGMPVEFPDQCLFYSPNHFRKANTPTTTPTTT